MGCLGKMEEGPRGAGSEQLTGSLESLPQHSACSTFYQVETSGNCLVVTLGEKTWEPRGLKQENGGRDGEEYLSVNRSICTQMCVQIRAMVYVDPPCTCRLPFV